MKGRDEGPVHELQRPAQWDRHISDQADAKIGAVNQRIRDLGELG